MRQIKLPGGGTGLMTWNDKTVSVNNNLGNRSASQMQGTTRELYDTLPMDGRTNFNFFLNAGSRQFPLTNINQNKLTAGENLTMGRIYFCVAVFDAVTGVLENITNFATIGATALNFYGGEFQIQVANRIVIKPAPLSSQFAMFNKSAGFLNNEVMDLDTLIQLPTDLQFQVDLQVPDYAAIANTQIRCVIGGPGTLFNSGVQL